MNQCRFFKASAVCFLYLERILSKISFLKYRGTLEKTTLLAGDDRGKTNESIIASPSSINLSTIAVSDKKTTMALFMRETDLMFFQPPTTSHIANKTSSTVTEASGTHQQPCLGVSRGLVGSPGMAIPPRGELFVCSKTAAGYVTLGFIQLGFITKKNIRIGKKKQTDHALLSR